MTVASACASRCAHASAWGWCKPMYRGRTQSSRQAAVSGSCGGNAGMANGWSWRTVAPATCNCKGVREESTVMA
ncbi:hypothetical protein D3C87_938840 [compost metagenome]